MSDGGAQVAVRRATVDDAAGLAGLRWACNAEFSGGHVVSRAEFTRGFAAWMRTAGERHVPFLAELDGQPVGMIWLAVVDRVPEPSAPLRAGGDLQSMYVLPHLRGRGIGARLVAAVVAEAAERRLQHLSVRAGRRPADFYRRLGFAGNDLVLELTP